jgi:hypothetical protein
MDLDALDGETGGLMRVRHGKHVVTLQPATDLSWQGAMAAAVDAYDFGRRVWPIAHRLPYRALKQVQTAWRRHNGLPDTPASCRRLAYMMSKYGDGVEFDLRNHLGLSAGELWRGRRWREMLAYIDMLPTNSHMNRLLVSDEEYMEIVVLQREKNPTPSRPSMAEFSMTNSLLMQLIDAVNLNTAINKAIANPKGPKPRIDPVPRPYTAEEKVSRQIQKARHEELVSMLLPKR